MSQSVFLFVPKVRLETDFSSNLLFFVSKIGSVEGLGKAV